MKTATPSVARLAAEASDRFDHEVSLNQLGCVLVAAQCGADATLVPHRFIAPDEPVCEGCRQGYHADPICEGAPCACACHTPHRQRGTGGAV